MAIFDSSFRNVNFCVVDIETTGFSPTCDGIVEIAAKRITSDGTVIDELNTLVNPKMRVKCSSIHGITDLDVVDAPYLENLTGHILNVFSDSIIVAYNAYFDIAFFEEQVFKRIGQCFNQPYLCAMYLRGLIGLNPAKLPFDVACKDAGIKLHTGHRAMNDVKMLCDLLMEYLKRAENCGYYSFNCLNQKGKKYKFLNSWNTDLKKYSESLSPIKLKPRGNSNSKTFIDEFRHFSKNLTSKLWDAVEPIKHEGHYEYLSFLVVALSDRLISRNEFLELKNIAVKFGLTPIEINACHQKFYEDVYKDAMEDGVLSEDEKKDLDYLKVVLGIDSQETEYILNSTIVS